MEKDKIIIVGAFHEIIELAEECNKNIIGLIDNNKQGKYMGYEILGRDEDAEVVKLDFKEEKIILSPDLPKTREQLYNLYKSIKFEFDSLISPECRFSKNVEVGKGVIIHRFVNISSNVKLGNFVRINVAANIMHDCKIDDFTTIAPNAVILGNVKIEKNVYIGANVTILPEISISNNVTVGAGAIVTKNLNSNLTYVGNPAEISKK